MSTTTFRTIQRATAEDLKLMQDEVDQWNADYADEGEVYSLAKNGRQYEIMCIHPCGYVSGGPLVKCSNPDCGAIEYNPSLFEGAVDEMQCCGCDRIGEMK